MDAAAQSVERAGKKMSEFGGKLAGVGAAITGFGGLMVREGAKYDRDVAGAVKQLQGAYGALGVEISRALLPAVRELAQFVSDLVTAWREMNPQVKDSIVHFGSLGAALLVIGGSTAKIAGLVMQFGALAVSAAPVLVTVGGIVIAVSLLYTAWKKNFGGMQTASKSLFASLREWAGQIPRWFDQAFQFSKKPLLAFMRGLEWSMRKLGKLMGFDTGPGSLTDTLREAADAFEKASLGDMFEGALDGLKESAEVIGDSLKENGAEFLEMLKKGMLKIAGLTKFGGGGMVSAGPLLADQEKAAAKAHAERWKELQRIQSQSHKAAVRAITEGTKQYDDELRTRLEARQALAKSLTADKLGQRGGAVLQGATQGAQAGGVWGAVIGAVAALLSQTQAFSSLIQQIEDGLGFIVDALEPLLAPMVVVGQLANDLLGAFGPLVDAFKLIGHAALFMTKGILEVNELILTGMRDIANALGLSGVAEYINVNLLTPVSKAAMSAQSAMDKLAASGTKAATANNAAANAGAAMVKSWAEELTNVPTGYKVSAARYGAADLGGTSGGMLPGGGGPVIEVNISGDLAPLVEKVETSQKKKNYRRTGSNYANNGKPVRGGDD